MVNLSNYSSLNYKYKNKIKFLVKIIMIINVNLVLKDVVQIDEFDQNLLSALHR